MAISKRTLHIVKSNNAAALGATRMSPSLLLLLDRMEGSRVQPWKLWLSYLIYVSLFWSIADNIFDNWLLITESYFNLLTSPI